MSNTDQRRRRVLRAIAPVAGLLAVGLLVWQGSYAAFSATTNNNADSWASGNLTLLNDAGTGTYAASTAALFTETAIKPGSTNVKCLTVAAGGTAGGAIKLYRGAITGTNSAALAPNLTIDVVQSAVVNAVPAPAVGANCANFIAAGSTAITPVGGTALSALPSTYATGLGTAVVPVNVSRWVTYKITYTFTSTGTNVGDNALQSSNAVADLNWEIQ
jgi:hypothetical protein